NPSYPKFGNGSCSNLYAPSHIYHLSFGVPSGGEKNSLLRIVKSSPTGGSNPSIRPNNWNRCNIAVQILPLSGDLRAIGIRRGLFLGVFSVFLIAGGEPPSEFFSE